MSKSSLSLYVHGSLPKYVSCMHQADIYRKRTNFQLLMRTIKAAHWLGDWWKILFKSSFVNSLQLCIYIYVTFRSIFIYIVCIYTHNVNKNGTKSNQLDRRYLFDLLSFGSDGQGTALLKVLWWRWPLGFGFLRSQNTWRLLFVPLRRLVLLLKAQQTWLRKRDRKVWQVSNLILPLRYLSIVHMSAVLIP